MSRSSRLSPRVRLLAAGLIAVLAVSLGHVLIPSAYGAQLGNRKLQLSNADVGQTADYLLSFDLATAGPLGSIVVQFCSNDPLPNDPCTVPIGFDDSAAVLANQGGETGFVIDPATTANQLILSRTVATSVIGPVSYHFTGVVNPTNPGSYYARVQTYATNDASGPASDYGGIAIAILNTIVITAEVPPYLIFCTGITITGLNCANAVGDYIDFGQLSATQASRASSQMLIATNAQSGYSVTVSGTTLASGINAITALGAADVSRPGVAQFGFNLRANTTPAVGNDPTGPGSAVPSALYNVANLYRFTTGDIVVTNALPDDLRQFTVSYIVNRPLGQAPGIYVSTMTYICLAKF